MPARQYDLSRVQCTVGSLPISGYGDGGVSISWDAANFGRSPNADGTGSVYSKVNDRGATVTIEVSKHERPYKILNSLMQTQLEDGGDLNIGFFLYDPSNGDRVRSRACVFMNQPEMAKGKTASTASFELSIEPRVLQIDRGSSL